MKETTEEELKSKMKFYEDEIEISIPVEYESFKVKLGQILGLENDFMQNLKLLYKGEPEEKIEIKNAEDYQAFTKYIKEKNELILLEVEVKEGANINKISVSINILSYNQQNNQQKNSQQEQILSFPIACTYCKAAPLYQTIYYCKECNQVFCMQCEVLYGAQHAHPYYKVATKPHYAYLNIGGQTKMEKFMEGVENTFNDAYNSVLGFFGKKKEENKDEKKDEKKEEKKEENKEDEKKDDEKKDDEKKEEKKDESSPNNNEQKPEEKKE